MIKRLLNNMFSRKSKKAAKSRDEQSTWQQAMKQFRKNRLAVFSLRMIKVLAIIALLADTFANEKPLMCSYQDTTYFPVFREYAVDLGMANWQEPLQNVDWHKLEYDWAIRTPVPYSPLNQDKLNKQSKSPFDDQEVASMYWHHWLGTNEAGQDILSGMIHGTRVALLVGLVAMSIASFIGILLGACAGYFGDERLQISRIRLFLNLIFGFFAFFFAFGVRGYLLSDSLAASGGAFLWELLLSLLIFVGIFALGNLLVRPLKAIPFFAKKVKIPVDIIVMRTIEIILSIPTLFLILAIIAMVEEPSLTVIMVIIGFTRWTGIARLMRGELLRIRGLEYIEAARALGFSEFRTILRHAIPNALSPVLIAIAFGVAAAILIEAFLSFLGLSPADLVTWGSMLNQARSNINSWWLAVFPGLAIFVTVTVLNLVGEGLTDALDPKLRK
jgi:peptide/nickel transport system permease protein